MSFASCGKLCSSLKTLSSFVGRSVAACTKHIPSEKISTDSLSISDKEAIGFFFASNSMNSGERKTSLSRDLFTEGYPHSAKEKSPRMFYKRFEGFMFK